ncbi:hypothetical protein D3C79_746370 [compost metagenome]
MRNLVTCAVAQVLAETHLRRPQVLGEACHHIGLDTLRFTQPRQGAAQLQQKRLALLETNPFGGFSHEAQHPANAAIGFAHGGIGDIEVHGLTQTATLYIEWAVLG